MDSVNLMPVEAPMHTWTARECAAKVSQGVVSAAAIADHFIGRVQRINPGVNALVQFDPLDVQRQACAVDARLAAGELLPLAGVPITVKDNLWVGGRRVSQGSKVFESFVAPKDAWVVKRLRDLGAVVLGITNCSEFACKGATDNLLYGATKHPTHANLTPGGSSGGAVAALAQRLGLLALGTDAGGSVRRPAAHTGLVGHKPSKGLIPNPWGFSEPNFGVSVVGLLATNAADCAWLFDHVAHFDAGDSSAPALPVEWGALHLTAEDPPSSLRIAWSPRLGCDFPIEQDVLGALEAAVQRLRGMKWNIADADPRWRSAVEDYPLDALQHAGLNALYGAELAASYERIDPDLAIQIRAGASTKASDRARVLRARDRVKRQLAGFFVDYDVLLCPTVPVTPWPNHQLAPKEIEGRAVGPRGHAAFTPLFNVCGVPACSVPVGTVRGLPVGLQIVAPCFEDATVLQVAAAIERLMA